MFGFKKRNEESKILTDLVESLQRNEITVKARKVRKGGDLYRSKFGGDPAVPADFVWPYYDAENFERERANRPLSFLCQINLAEICDYDKEGLLPKVGILSFFYEQETMCWGFDPSDKGCARVYYFEDVSGLESLELPGDLKDEYRVKEYDLVFSSKMSYPSYEEVECYTDDDGIDWDEYDELLEKKHYDLDFERHKLLGYANLIQGEMLTECERTTSGIYCGDSESYESIPEDEKERINKAAADWVLLFQMASIQDEDYELMFGDLGNLYFYIKKQDLKERRFDKAWLILQCG